MHRAAAAAAGSAPAPMAEIDQAFHKKRRLLLLISSIAIVLMSVPLMLRFGHQGNLPLAVMQLVYIAGSLITLLLLSRSLDRQAALFFSPLMALAIACNGWFFDIPTPEAPRTIHLYLIPLAIAAHFINSRESRLARLCVQLSLLALLVLLVVLPNPWSQPQTVPLEERRMLLWLVPGMAVALVLIVVRLIDRDQVERSRIELALAHAIASQTLELYFQPQCDADGKPHGVESLLRWQHPDFGFVSPASFVPLAERNGLIHPMGDLVLHKACEFARLCLEQPGIGKMPVAVNISAAQLSTAEHRERLLALAKAEAMPAGTLKFELTESVFATESDALRAWLLRCHELGITTSLDDFGTGYSSLSYLSGLPFDQLKIDQSFVRGEALHGRGRNIAQTIVNLGRQLGMEVIAEGVETETQREQLQAMGCHRFQGYLFAKPMPTAACLEWLQTHLAGPR